MVHSASCIGTGSEQCTNGWYRITTVYGCWYQITTGEMVPDMNRRCAWYQIRTVAILAHKYRITKMVQEGWTYLEVKDYTWKIEALVHEMFNFLAQ